MTISSDEEDQPEENTDLPIRMTASPLDISESVLVPKTIHIQEEETGHSYKKSIWAVP